MVNSGKSVAWSIMACLTVFMTQKGICKSEALATSFFPKSLITRGGGASNRNNKRGSLTCVLRSSQSNEAALFSNGDDLNGRSHATSDELTDPSPSDDELIEARKLRILRGGSTSSEMRRPSSGLIDDDRAVRADYVAETNLPTDIGQYRLRAYRVPSRFKNQYVGTEPCVIYCADKPPFGKDGNIAENVPVRIHDQCFTSEVFRSKRCDCKEQLKLALHFVRENGGAIIYLQQEGRGIGLANKVAAYALQDVGMDTVDSNIHLGFPEDCRQYGVVPAILKDMKIDSIQLITNNPRKVERLTDLGVKVSKTIPMVVEKANIYNRKYLQTKQDRMNHTNFGDMLAASSPSVLSGIDISETTVSESSGVVLPKRKLLADEFINDGEEMAAAAVTSCLLDDLSQSGVHAAKDGYCFGRKSVEDAITAVKNGEMVVVVDDEDRENEGDFIMAADMCTPEAMAQIVRYSSGVVCVGMEGDRMDALKLPAMVSENEDPKGTAFSVTVDASKEHGITTGISATDRAKTVQLLADESTGATDFVRPGHIFPLRANEGGVLSRDGHTEAAVDLSRLAGLRPCGVLCEIVSEDDPISMARLPELKRFCKKHGYVLTSIVDIAQYRRDTEQ
jgi:3,4-dihydroxy 2-butanone 4-phosphate synthase/GTP cyclohydrolase II